MCRSAMFGCEQLFSHPHPTLLVSNDVRKKEESYPVTALGLSRMVRVPLNVGRLSEDTSRDPDASGE